MGRRRSWPARALALSFAALSGLLGTSAVAAAQTSQTPTFSKDVAPIFQRSCQNCHRPGSIAPMSLIRYEDTRPWVRSIKQRVSQRSMPPWHVDKGVGITRFKDDPSLSDEEIATIVSWIDGGAPQGNPADLPAPRVFDDADKWHIGKPDLIVEMPTEFTVEAAAEDWWGNFVAETGLTEDRYIKAVEAKPGPGGQRVVHHIVSSLVNDGGPAEGGTLVEYAVGKNGDVFPDGSGKLMKAGSKIAFNMHYHSAGEAVKDRSSVGIIFYPKGVTPKHVLTTAAMDFYDLDLPAGADNVRTDIYFKFDKPTRLAGFMPHMHNRGRAECLEVIYPSMAVEQLNCVSHFDFQWQIAYNYADDVTPLLPAGTILHVINWHDNSKGNRLNPDPRNWVGYGQRSIDEMSRFWITYYSLSEDEFQALVAERNAKKAGASTNNNQQ